MQQGDGSAQRLLDKVGMSHVHPSRGERRQGHRAAHAARLGTCKDEGGRTAEGWGVVGAEGRAGRGPDARFPGPVCGLGRFLEVSVCSKREASGLPFGSSPWLKGGHAVTSGWMGHAPWNSSGGPARRTTLQKQEAKLIKVSAAGTTRVNVFILYSAHINSFQKEAS